MQIEQRLTERGGCARRREIVRSRSDADELALLVAAGRVQRVRHGLYALPGTGTDVIGARLVSGAVTCLSAARHMRLRLLSEPSAAHVALPEHRAAPRPGQLPAGTVLHWTTGLDSPGWHSNARASSRPAPTVWRPGPRIAPPDIVLAHAVGCLPFVEAVALLDGALHDGVVRHEDLLGRRPRTGWLDFDRVLRACDGRSPSIPETFMRVGLQTAGLTVEPQVMIDGVGHVDLLVEGVVVVETDGFAYHGDRIAFREDRRRDRALALNGLPSMRFPFHDAVYRTVEAVQEVSELVHWVLAGGARAWSRRSAGRP